MIKRLDWKDEEMAGNILDLQIASYKIEAEMIGFDELPPLKDTIDTIQKCEETFYGYFIEGALAGIVSYKVIDTMLDIH
jgi:hypothetical protein